MRKKVENIIVHISDSTWGSAREIDSWHKQKGWKMIGYHFVIDNSFILPDFELYPMNGSIELGRPLDGDLFIEENEIGAHALGYNDKSIGVCGIGKEGWTKSQECSLIMLLRALCSKFNIPKENVLGHYETEGGKAQGKTCPNLDMDMIRAEL